MTEARKAMDRRWQLAILFAVAVVVAELVLLPAAAAFFRAMNQDIPPGLLNGLLPVTPNPSLPGEALHARLAWIASVVVALFASAGAILLAVTKILKEPEPLRRQMLYWLAGLVLVAASVATISDVSRELLQVPVLEPTIGHFRVGGIAVATTFAETRRVVNALFSAAAVAIVLALLTRSCLGPTRALLRGEPLDLRGRRADLHALLLAAAAVLVSIVITMAAWLAWPTAGLTTKDAAFHVIVEIGRGVGIYWGTVFSLCLVLAYLPCLGYLNMLAEANPDPNASEDFGRDFKVVQDVVALLSPFISALIPVFLV